MKVTHKVSYQLGIKNVAIQATTEKGPGSSGKGEREIDISRTCGSLNQETAELRSGLNE